MFYGRVRKLRKENQLSADFHRSAKPRLPERKIKYVMQSERNQCTLHQTVQPGSRVTRLQHNAAYRVDSLLNDRPDKKHQNPDNRKRQSADNRYKPRAPEKGQNLRQLDLIKPIVQGSDAKSDNDTAKYTHLKRSDSDNRCRRAFQHGFRSPMVYDHRADRRMHNKKCNCRRQCRNFFFFLCHSDGYAHGKNNRQVPKYNIPGRTHHL